MNRKNAILEAARGEFGAHGYAGARIERIAATASANKQLIFHYFGSKDGLYAAVIAGALAGSPRAPTGALQPPEALRRLVAELATWLIRTPGAAVAIAECAPGRSTPEDARAQVAAWMRSQSGAIGDLLDDGQRKGYFRDDIDRQAIVELVVGAPVGLALSRAQSSPGASSADGFPALLSQIVVESCAWR